jgi:iron(III) transport system substrate-binding protein
MSGGGGVASPFDLFSLVWGEQKTLDILQKLLANKPIFKSNVPPVINAVAAGEAAIGLGSIHEAERLKMRHAPIEWKTYGEYVPVVTLGYALTKASPQPNLGRLFLAWFVTEGMKIFEEMEFSSRITMKGSKLGQLLKERAPNAKVLEPTNLQQLKAFEAFSDKVVKIVSASALNR